MCSGMPSNLPRANVILAIPFVLVSACGRGSGHGMPSAGATATADSLEGVAQSRELTPDEARAALETYVPPGKYDEFVMVTSGGHSGSIYLIGIPSMRLLKEIPVYAPNPWQGWEQGTAGARGLGEREPLRLETQTCRRRPGAISTILSSR